MSVVLTLSLIAIIVFCGEWKTVFSVYADVLSNKYTINICVFGINIMRTEISYDGFVPALGYIWLRSGDKRIGISLTGDENERDSLRHYLASPLAAALDVKSLRIDAGIGAAGYDAESALLAEAARLFAAVFVSGLKSMQKAEISGSVHAAFGKDMLELYIYGIIGATPANIIYGFIAAFVKKHVVIRERDEKRGA